MRTDSAFWVGRAAFDGAVCRRLGSSRRMDEVLRSLGACWKGLGLAGDKGPSYRQVRRYLRRRGIKAVIPTRKDQPRDPHFDKEWYRRRNVVERSVPWLKEDRRRATRHKILAVNLLAMAKLAMIRRCLRVLSSSDRTWKAG